MFFSVDTMEEVYPGTYGGKTNARRESIEDNFTQKFNHCSEENKVWLRFYKALTDKLVFFF